MKTGKWVNLLCHIWFLRVTLRVSEGVWFPLLSCTVVEACYDYEYFLMYIYNIYYAHSCKIIHIDTYIQLLCQVFLQICLFLNLKIPRNISVMTVFNEAWSFSYSGKHHMRHPPILLMYLPFFHSNLISRGKYRWKLRVWIGVYSRHYTVFQGGGARSVSGRYRLMRWHLNNTH